MLGSKLLLYNGEKKNGVIFRYTYLTKTQTTGPISFKFGMYGRVYGGNKICEFDRNQPSGCRDMRG